MLLCTTPARPTRFALAAAACLASAAAAADEPSPACLPGGGGWLEMQISGDFEAVLDWGNEGTRCEGGPRPAGDALRLMFSRADEALLVVIGVTGVARGAAGGTHPANLTVVREGLGHFYGSLGADACEVEVEENSADPAEPDLFIVSGRGRCELPIEAIAREGEIRVAAFAFRGRARWSLKDE